MFKKPVPGSPRNLKAVASGTNEVIVSWLPPTHPRGKITHYTVHWAPPGAKSHSRVKRIDSHLTFATLKDLSAKTYQVIY